MGSSAWAFWIGGGVLGACGVGLLLWALFADRARGRRRCPRCWYDMAGVPGLRCPECGRAAGREKRLGRTRRRWRWAGASAIVMIGGLAVTRVPDVVRDGWLSAVPTSVLSATMSFFDRTAADRFESIYQTRNGSGMRRVIVRQVMVGVAGDSTWDRLLVARRCAVLIGAGEPPDREAEIAVESPWFARNESEREVALWVVDSLGEERRLAVGAARRRFRALPETSFGERRELVEALVRWSTAGGRVSRTEAAIHDPSPEVRECLVGDLVRGTPDKQLLPTLMAALGDSDGNVRAAAARAIFKFGPDGKETLPALRRQARVDRDAGARDAARDAIHSITGEYPAPP